MLKILLLAIAIWLVIVVLKNYRENLHADSNIRKDSEKDQTEKMVQCSECGVHIPASDSLVINHQYYCCEAHAANHQPGDDNNQQ